jgi:hypothetical protein
MKIRGLKNDKGLALVELALCLPVVLTLLSAALGAVSIFSAQFDANHLVSEASLQSFRRCYGVMMPDLKSCLDSVRADVVRYGVGQAYGAGSVEIVISRYNYDPKTDRLVLAYSTNSSLSRYSEGVPEEFGPYLGIAAVSGELNVVEAQVSPVLLFWLPIEKVYETVVL